MPTKAYVLSFSEALAEELLGSGVRATCLCPARQPRTSPPRQTWITSSFSKWGRPDAKSVALAGLRSASPRQVIGDSRCEEQAGSDFRSFCAPVRGPEDREAAPGCSILHNGAATPTPLPERGGQEKMRPTGGIAMNRRVCWAAVCVAILLLPKAAASADAGQRTPAERARLAWRKRILTPPLPPSPRPSDSTRRIPKPVSTGAGLHKEGRPRQGYRRLYRGHPARPERFQSRDNRSIVYERKGEWDKASRTAWSPFGSTRRTPKPMSAGAGPTRKRATTNKAIADYGEAIRLDPKDAKTYDNRGIVYQRMGEWDKAIADFTEVIRINPKDANVYASRGLFIRSEGRSRQGHRGPHGSHPARSKECRQVL